MNHSIKLFALIGTLIPLVACGSTTPDFSKENPRSDLYYEVFVRSFADSDGDGIGDLNGLTNRLDYFDDLGVTGLWLMPIHPSPTYHGYDITDYYAINPDYGTMEDFENLIEKAEEHDIKIMIDFVVNHSSDQHPWFKAALRAETPYKDWYVKRDSSYYAYFVGGMPDFNLRNPEVVDEIYAIGDYWMDKGVQGFRLDAAKHYFTYETPIEYPGASINENIAFVANLRSHLRETNPNVYVISEVLDSPFVYQKFFAGADSTFDFEVGPKVLGVAKANTSGSPTYVNYLASLYEDFADVEADYIDAPLLRSHDSDRVANYLNGNSDKERLAAEMYLLLPGNPFIYYGEEIGMYGARLEGVNVPGYGVVYDETRRLPFRWGTEETPTWFPNLVTDKNNTILSATEQMTSEKSLLKTYQTLGQLRKNTPALRYGKSFIPYGGNSNKVQGYYRAYEFDGYRQIVFVIHNVSTTEQVLDLSYEGTLLYGQNSVLHEGNQWTIPAQSSVVIELPDNALETLG